ncbi:hypothetical protein CARUB_v10007451mg [Capsella rubella]|uniref:Defensin-like protein n=1 Tax=Capsella rubella TaxID=81985 RepID=R0FAS1_9BRAS|nr:hypothetical protein CARUB_v10007451mg [Capsella rubella]
MENTSLLVVLFIFFIMFVSAVNPTKADTCKEGLGTCKNCDQRCKTKYGASSQGNCDGSVGLLVCTCHFKCGIHSPPPPLSYQPQKTCNGGAGFCSKTCNKDCCDSNCAQKYDGGTGFCNTIGHANLCQCVYPC